MSTNPNRWRDGTRVSHRYRPEITGRIKIVTRQADGAKFARVKVDDLAHVTFEGWADRAWILGVGPHEADCLDCGQPYRYEQAAYGDGFCPECNHDERQNSTAPETRSISGLLYGARTPRAKVEPVTVPPVEPFEDPFS